MSINYVLLTSLTKTYNAISITLKSEGVRDRRLLMYSQFMTTVISSIFITILYTWFLAFQASVEILSTAAQL